MEQAISVDSVFDLARKLSAVDKVRLFELMAPEIKRELQATLTVSRESLRGLWKGVNITDEDLSEVRREMWGNFPREDF